MAAGRSGPRNEVNLASAKTPKECLTRSADETRAFGERLAHRLRVGDVVLLQGDLGAGKTTLIQGLARGLGIADYVQSPTFILVAEYDGRAADGTPLRLYHLDLYRLDGTADLASIGFDDYLAPTDGVTVIEWPERAGDDLPETYLLIEIAHAGEDRRRLTVTAVPPDGPAADRLNRLARDLAVEPAEVEDPIGRRRSPSVGPCGRKQHRGRRDDLPRSRRQSARRQSGVGSREPRRARGSRSTRHSALGTRRSLDSRLTALDSRLD
jgi:tRNA threonylcarbamoyladenosine biosynthesis protein TsaE